MGLYALRGTGLSFARGGGTVPAVDRHGLLVAVARLDVAFEAEPQPSAAHDESGTAALKCEPACPVSLRVIKKSCKSGNCFPTNVQPCGQDLDCVV